MDHDSLSVTARTLQSSDRGGVTNTNKMATKSKYLIIGFGEFGAAAANHLQNTKSAGELELTILDMHSEQAASLDLYKIVREDYANLHRMKHAIYVHQQWKSNPMFQPYYHSTGRVVVYHPPSISVLNQIDKNRSSLGLPPRKRLTMQSIASCPVSGLSPRERKAMEFISGIMENTNDQENLTFVYNEDDGVVQWDRCMSEMRKSCKKRGANVRKAEVQGLVIGGDWVEAIQLKDGEEIKTDDTNIILAAGSWIMQLLARSNITLPLPARAPVATGVFAFHLRLSDAQREKFLDIPPLSVYGIDMPPADGGEYLPPIMHNGIVKVGWTLPFRNMCNHPSVSYPEDVSTSYLACKALHQVRKWVESYLPELKGAEIIAIRSPW
jgi:glycine/D-amino acid oxidase-like deaminating enzyme